MSKYFKKVFLIAFLFLTVSAILSFLLTQLSTNKEESSPRFIPKNGVYENYDAATKLKTSITYKDGLKQGTSYVYDKRGNLQLELTYEKGKRIGQSTKYYTSGEIYTTSNYVSNKLHGSRVKYYRNGSKRSEVEYYKGFLGIGLKEWYKNQRAKTIPSTLKVSHKTTQSWTINAPDACDRNYLIVVTDLVNNLFYNASVDSNILLGSENRKVEININKYTLDYLKGRDVVCQCTTSQGNRLIIPVIL